MLKVHTSSAFMSRGNVLTNPFYCQHGVVLDCCALSVNTLVSEMNCYASSGMINSTLSN